jgi:hypothetical protein
MAKVLLVLSTRKVVDTTHILRPWSVRGMAICGRRKKRKRSLRKARKGG